MDEQEKKNICILIAHLKDGESPPAYRENRLDLSCYFYVSYVFMKKNESARATKISSDLPPLRPIPSPSPPLPAG